MHCDTIGAGRGDHMADHGPHGQARQAAMGCPRSVLAGTSIAIGVGAARNWHARAFLLAAIALNLAYWAIGQGLGGIFQGGATDPNAGPLFIRLAGALYALVPVTANARRG